jgi:hypothetical protein
VPELNAVLRELMSGTQAILAGNFVAAYLQGSLAIGDWDSHSDVDFIIAIRREVTATTTPWWCARSFGNTAWLWPGHRPAKPRFRQLLCSLCAR